MEVEHSRLLKFFTNGCQKSEMEETPAITIEKHYENPKNVEAEVPGSQKIREIKDKNISSDNTASEIEVTGAEFTLSPVITVTKKESTLTKGDMKMQKVTVTEDISIEESQNGGYTITRELKNSMQTDSQPGRTIITRERREGTVKEGNMDKAENSPVEKKSKIPIMRLRQVVEKVKRERQAQKAKEKPRRSSIPKLKDPQKAIKRESSLQINPRTEYEFEKIYEEIVDNKQKEIDDKILAVNIEDTEKIESKFEELIHSYDEEENERQTVSRISKIPALRRRDVDQPGKNSALVDKHKAKNTVTETKLKDGGFNVSASSIKTKRFSRGNSRDLSKDEQKVDVTNTIDIRESGDNEVFVTETVKKVPVKPARTVRSTRRQVSRDGQDVVETIEKTEYTERKNIVRETIIKENTNVGGPVKIERINHGVSEELTNNSQNRNVTEKDLKNNGNTEVVVVEEINDDGSHTIITTTTVTENLKPVETKRIIHDASRENNEDEQHMNVKEKYEHITNSGNSECVTVEEFRDGGHTITKKITVTETAKSGTPVITETIVQNINREISSEDQNVGIVEDNSKEIVTKETKEVGNKKITKNIIKENVKMGIPVRTESFTRGISREMGNIKPKANKEVVTVEEIKDDGRQTVIKKSITRENVKVGIPVRNESIEKRIKEGNITRNETLTTKETNIETGQKIIKETFIKETIKENTSSETNDSSNIDFTKPEDDKDRIKKETMETEYIVKEGIKVGIPVYTKVTESLSKDRIQNVEISKTIEWKPADTKSKNYTRSASEYITKKELKDQISISEVTDTTDKSKVQTHTEKTEVVNTQDNKPSNSVLESKIKDNVKDIANKILIKKVTEYESKEQETNVEKKTFTLSKSVDLSTERNSEELSRDKIRKDPKEISEQISLTTTKEKGEINSKQVNKEYSTEMYKETITTDTSIEKKEFENNYMPVQEKDIDVEEVTILKGNVSRLKNKLCTQENEGATKKETNEELPQKKSILSKIAVFERLEPTEAYPVIKKIDKEKKISKVATREINFEEKPKIVEEQLNERSKLDCNANNVNGIGLNNDEIIYNNEPIIVKEFWKTKELNVHESNEIQTNESHNEFAKTIPVKIEHQTIENQNEIAKGGVRLDNNIKSRDNHLEVPASLLGNTDFESEIGKTRPGKIDLNIWKNQVEVNKTLVDKIDVIKSQSLNEIAKTLPGKIELNTFESQISKDLPLKPGLKLDEIKYELDETLPSKNGFEIKKTQFEVAITLPGNIDFKTDDGFKVHEHVDIALPDIQLKGAKPLPAKIDFTSTNPIELPKILPDKNNGKVDIQTSVKEIEVVKPKPGKINLNLWKNQIEVNKNIVSKIDQKISKESKELKGINTLPARIDTKIYDNKDELIKTGKIEFDTKENKIKGIRTLTGNSGSQIEIPVILADKAKLSSTDNQVEPVKTLPGNTEYITNDTQVETSRLLPEGIILNDTESQEIPNMLPAKIELRSTENQREDLSNLSEKIDVKFDKKRTEIPVVMPGKLDLRAWENQIEKNKTLIGTVTYKTEEKEIESIRALPRRTNFITYESLVETPKNLPGRTEISTYENKVQVIRTSQEANKLDLGTPNTESNVQLNHFYSGTDTSENKDLDNDTIQRNKELKIDGNNVEMLTDLGTTESPSDPELVDEPDIDVEDHKPSIMGKINNKMYFITNHNIIKNSTNNPIKPEISVVSDSKEINTSNVEEMQTKTYYISDKNTEQNTMNQNKTIEKTTTASSSTTKNYEKIENIEENYNSSNFTMEYEFNTNINTVQNKSNNESETTEHIITTNTEANEKEFNYYAEKVQNRMTKSEYGAQDCKTTRDEMLRAKSLAELDLGDMIEGKVRRIVGRMKSVDFGRREEKKAEKISIKEMPKKMSVLEKIALFERKASITKTETTTCKTTTIKKNETQALSEEEIIQKIEELTTAKARLGKMENMMYVRLANGIEMPVIAVGTALLDNRLLPHVIGAAIDLGYRAFDTAYIYGNEKEIGQTIQAKIDDGTVKREDLFIMSKLWSTYHRCDLVEEACRSSLKNMGLEYFDLYMIHNPMSFKEGSDPIPKIATVLQYSQYDYLDAWFGMEGLVSKGLVKSIGVSNFNSQQIQNILDKGRVKPVVNQVECHPYLSQQRLHDYCADHNIILSCFGVLGSKGTPAEFKSSVTPVIDDALVQVMASGLNVSPAQLLIRYQIESGHNVVVKSSSAAHLWDNLQALTFTLAKPQVDALHALNKNKRTFTFKGMGDTHKNYPF